MRKMSFLERRRFNFFSLRVCVDSGSLAETLEGTNVTATSSGHGTIVICDDQGVIHLINRNFDVTTFQGYLCSVSLAEQMKSFAVLATVGENETGIPLIKIWDLDKSDRHGNPVCMMNLRTTAAKDEARSPSVLCLNDYPNLVALGFHSGAIILYRGNVTRDRTMKAKLLRNSDQPVTGLAFKVSSVKSSKKIFLFVATETSVLSYDVTNKDKEEERMPALDVEGCAIKCSILADSIHHSPFMIARDDAVFCYTLDGRGPCHAIDGKKIFLQCFRNYLVIVSKGGDNVQSPVTMSATKMEDPLEGDSLVTLLDIQNNFVVYSAIFPDLVAVLPEWGSFFILTKNYKLHQLVEKDLQSKLDLLFKKGLYDIYIRIAKNHEYDGESLIKIFRQYGDHLYDKGDYNGAVDQYIKTIGSLEPSYVIRKFLDSQNIDNLIKYLSALHEKGVATSDHTTLLFNCYIKLNKVDKLKEFVLQTRNSGINFDVDAAINVCRKSCAKDAVLLAEKFGLHDWYVKILLEDEGDYAGALEYVTKLPTTAEAAEMMVKFGDVFIENVPERTTEFAKKLCLAGGEGGAAAANPEDFLHLFLKNSEKLADFLEYLTKFPTTAVPWPASIYNTLLEHYLLVWRKCEDPGRKSEWEQKITGMLESSDPNYDKNHALVLCTAAKFYPGMLHLMEENKLYYQILKHHLARGNYQGVLTTCKKFGFQEPTLWVKAASAAVEDANFPPNILAEILSIIEKENLLSPTEVIETLSKSKWLSLAHAYGYLRVVMTKEKKIVDEEAALVDKHKRESGKKKEILDKIKNESVIFQGSRCNACKNQLELPSIYFLCQHSYHKYCYESLAENDGECPACWPDNNKVMGVIKAQEQRKDFHEVFHSQLERSQDGFSLVADYFGRGVFGQIPVMVKDTSKKSEMAVRRLEPVDNKKFIKVANKPEEKLPSSSPKRVFEPRPLPPMERSKSPKKEEGGNAASNNNKKKGGAAVATFPSEPRLLLWDALEKTAVSYGKNPFEDGNNKNPFGDDDDDNGERYQPEDDQDAKNNPFC